MFENYRTFKYELAGRPLVIETGKIAQLSNGSCLVRYGDTAILRKRNRIRTLPATASTSSRFPSITKRDCMRSARSPADSSSERARPSEKAILTSPCYRPPDPSAVP